MKKTITYIAATLFIILLLVEKGSAIGYTPNKNYNPDKPYFSLMNPWDSFRTFLPSSSSGIPDTFVNGFDEFRSWYSALPNLSDNIASYWTRLTGNVCEKAKIETIQERRAMYLVDRRDFSVGWWDEWTVDGAEITINGVNYPADEAYKIGVQKYLRDFLINEFGKLFDDGGGYSLIGPNGSITCQNGQPYDIPDVITCSTDDPGEYCVNCPENGKPGECKVDEELYSAAWDAREKIAELYCMAGATGGVNIDDNNWESFASASKEYLKYVIEFYTRASALVPHIPELNMMYVYNDATKTYQWAYEDAQEGPIPPPKSCLSGEYSKFVNVNYTEACACPAFQVSWTDLKGLFQELIGSMKNLGNLRSNIQEIINTVRDTEKWGERWDKFNDEIKEEAKAQFKRQYGYYPKEDEGSGATWRRFLDFFKNLTNPANFVQATLTLDNEIIIPPRNLKQILKDVENAVSISWLQNQKSAEEKRAIEQIIRKERGQYAMQMVNDVNNILAASYELGQAATTLGGPGVACEEVKNKIYQSQQASMSNPNSSYEMGNQESWSNFYKGASSFDSAMSAFFTDKENDTCEVAEEIKEKMKLQ